MRRTILAILAVLTISALTFTGLVLYSSQAEKPVENAINTPTEQIPLNADTIFNLVNAEREKAGLKPLVRDARLDATAQARADDMVARNYFSHNDPVTGENLVNILKGQKQCASSGENIVEILYRTTMEDNKEAVHSWMNSEPHRNAILDPQHDSAGLAVSGTKVVQHFCNLK